MRPLAALAAALQGLALAQPDMQPLDMPGFLSPVGPAAPQALAMAQQPMAMAPPLAAPPLAAPMAMQPLPQLAALPPLAMAAPPPQAMGVAAPLAPATSPQAAGNAYASTHPQLLEHARDPAVFNRYQAMLRSYSVQLEKKEAIIQAKEEAKLKAEDEKRKAEYDAKMRREAAVATRQNQQILAAAGLPMTAIGMPMPAEVTDPYGPSYKPQQRAQQLLSQPVPAPFGLSGQPGGAAPLEAFPEQLGAQPPSVLAGPPQAVPVAPARLKEDQIWSNPQLWSNYKRNMVKIDSPTLPFTLTQSYTMHDATTNNCGPVPLQPLRLKKQGALEVCQQQCDNEINCIGFVTDIQQTECLFRTWKSLENCKTRYKSSMMNDDKFMLFLKKDLMLDRVA